MVAEKLLCFTLLFVFAAFVCEDKAFVEASKDNLVNKLFEGKKNTLLLLRYICVRGPSNYIMVRD